MKFKFICFWICLNFFSSSTFCQDTAWQSIQAANDDSAKVIRLADYAYSLSLKDEERALKIYDDLMRLSKKLNYPYWIGMTWFNIACIDANRANDKKAIDHFQLALHYLNQTNRIDQIASCYLNIGSMAERLGNVDLKLSSLNQAIHLLEGSKYRKLLNHAYNNMGAMLFNQNQYTKGFSYFEKAMSAAKEIKDTNALVTAFFGMSNCSGSAKKYVEAERYSKESLRIAILSGNNHHLSVANTSFS